MIRVAAAVVADRAADVRRDGVQVADELLDGQGTIIGKDLRGEDLDKAVAKAVARK